MLTLTKTDYVVFTCAVLIIWGGLYFDSVQSKKPHFIKIESSLGVYQFQVIYTTNRFYEEASGSNGPSITTFHGVWSVQMYPLSQVTNKKSW